MITLRQGKDPMSVEIFSVLDNDFVPFGTQEFHCLNPDGNTKWWDGYVIKIAGPMDLDVDMTAGHSILSFSWSTPDSHVDCAAYRVHNDVNVKRLGDDWVLVRAEWSDIHGGDPAVWLIHYANLHSFMQANIQYWLRVFYGDNPLG